MSHETFRFPPPLPPPVSDWLDALASRFGAAQATGFDEALLAADPAEVEFALDPASVRLSGENTQQWNTTYSASGEVQVEFTVGTDGSLEIMERIEGGAYQISTCSGAPAVLGWATGELPEPPNNPQVGMANMRLVMPALQKAKPAAVKADAIDYQSVTLPAQKRETRLVKDTPVEVIAQEIVDWLKN